MQDQATEHLQEKTLAPKNFLISPIFPLQLSYDHNLDETFHSPKLLTQLFQKRRHKHCLYVRQIHHDLNRKGSILHWSHSRTSEKFFRPHPESIPDYDCRPEWTLQLRQ